MSDDGFYAASPYEEYEDFWDEEPPLDLADDLTQRVAYSPVYQDNPHGELEPYHSDWEWYSDDYYDDDPSLVIKNTLDGGGGESKLAEQTHVKRGRKRKLDEARGHTKTIEHNALLDTIRGTVWATSELETDSTFHKGQQEKVALLTNWRDLFRQENGTLRTFGKGQLRRDESWAKDMSLSDMGLVNEHKRATYMEEKQADAESEYASEQDGYFDGRSDELGQDVFEIDDALVAEESSHKPLTLKQAHDQSSVYTKRKSKNSIGNGNVLRPAKVLSQEPTEPSSSKRRRASSTSITGPSIGINGNSENADISSIGEKRPTRKKQKGINPLVDIDSANSALNLPVKPDAVKGKKRKFSAQSELFTAHENGDRGQRPSRQHQSSHTTDHGQEAEESEAPLSRRTRSKKK